ncbi:hypothetical protein [Vibrio variabilis]
MTTDGLIVIPPLPPVSGAVSAAESTISGAQTSVKPAVGGNTGR